MGSPLQANSDGGVESPTLSKIVQWFKTMTTNEYIRGVKKREWPSFPKRLWQRNYYERIIRDENELSTVQTYIHNNPLNWATDAENPLCDSEFRDRAILGKLR